jgi:transcriptional regulator with XRE-family HTH domain
VDLQTLGTVLEARRSELGIPRTVLARKVGISPSYMWMVETAAVRKGGQPSRPSRDLLEAWTEALLGDAVFRAKVLMLAGHTASSEGTDLPAPLGLRGYRLEFPSQERRPDDSPQHTDSGRQDLSSEDQAIAAIRLLLGILDADTRQVEVAMLKSYVRWRSHERTVGDG